MNGFQHIELNTMVLAAIKLIVIFVTFGYAAISDWIKREIHPLIWVPSVLIGVIINYFIYHSLNFSIVYHDLVNNHLNLSLVVSTIIIILTAILSFVLGFIGGADVLALISFVSIFPSNLELLHEVMTDFFNDRVLFIILLLPPILHVFLLYLFIVIILIVTNIISNVTEINNIRKLGIPLRKAVIYVAFGRVMRAKDFLSRKFYYPVYIPGLLDRITFNVNEDYQAWIKKLKELNPETLVIAVWGVPMVSLTAIAVYIYGLAYLILMML